MYTLADAFGSGIGAINNMYKTQMLKDELATHPELVRAQLELQKSRAAMGMAQAQYAPENERNKAYQLGVDSEFARPLAQANLGYRQAQIPNLQATTEATQERTRLMPLDSLIKAQQVNQVGSRFGAAYEALNAIKQMPAPTRDAWIAQHQQQYADWINELSSKEGQKFINDKVLQHFFPEFGIGAMHGNAPISPETVRKEQEKYATSEVKPDVLTVGNGIGTSVIPNIQQILTNAQGPNDTNKLAQNAPGIAAPATAPGRFPTTPEQTAQLENASKIAANNAATTAATRRQLEGALQVEGIMNDPDFQSKATNAALYAGALGKGKAALSALSQKNPAAYEDYIAFRDQTLPLLANRIKTLDQMGATDKQREDLNNLFNKTALALTSNPEQFIIQINKLGEMLNTVAEAVEKSATPIVPMKRTEGYKEIENPYTPKATISKEHITDENIAHTAKLRGISEDEVRKKLKAKGLL